MHPQLRRYLDLADAVARLFHPHVEVVVHDAASGTIAHIANAFSRRRPGDGSLIAGDADFEPNVAISGPYPKRNWNGHRLRAVTVALHDDGGALIGHLCINHDVEAAAAAVEALQAALALPQDAPQPKQFLGADWREDVNALIGTLLAERGVTMAGLTAAECDGLLRALDQRGVFEIRTAPTYVAGVFGWSRATLYARLKAARAAAPANGQGAEA